VVYIYIYPYTPLADGITDLDCGLHGGWGGGGLYKLHLVINTWNSGLHNSSCYYNNW